MMTGTRERYSIPKMVACLALLSVVAGEAAGVQAQDTGGMLEIVKGETTGLRAIMQKWHDAELAEQGGEFQSHGWWLWGLTAFDYDNDGDVDLMPSHHGLAGALIIKNLCRETGRT